MDSMINAVIRKGDCHLCHSMRNLSSSLNKLIFSILLAGHKICPPDWVRKNKRPRYYSLWYVIKGRGEVVINGKKHKLQPGRLVIFTPQMVCDKKSYRTNPLEFYYVRFSYAMAFEDKDVWQFKHSQDVPFPLKGVYTISNHSAVTVLLEQLSSLAKRQGTTVNMQKRIVFGELLLTFVEDFNSQMLSGDSKKAIEGTIEYMINHYKNTITLSELSQIAGLSTSHYSRLFKKYIGLSPIDYLTHLRIDRAKELLVLSDVKIKEVSQTVGYGDELYFSRTFKRIIGVSPSQYCEDHKQISGELSNHPDKR
ncbi:AraC family transcriptional regulator [Metabacillus halosaccharovorans]|uniref:AraC family transcriptional regulator n=1 Tax=Metabacillus halosaccharovorans TaxID=930124 RepID=UPI00403E158E